MMRTAIGSPYTERRLRNFLHLNVVPLFENKGHLKVSFPTIRAARPSAASGVAVDVTVDEGAVYKLDSALISGAPGDEAELLAAAKLPIGKVADWSAIDEGLRQMEQLLGNAGHLAANARAQRRFDDANQTVSLSVAINPGPVFTFGTLVLIGLDEKSEAKARKRWQLASGEPMNAGYVTDYLRELSRSGLIAGRSMSQEFKPRPGSQTIDLQLVFR